MMLGAAVLVVAGAPKVVDRPSESGVIPRWASRPLGVAELLVGCWALLAPGSGGAWACTLAYVALSVTMVVAMVTRAPDCGCFGSEPVRPSGLHLAVDLVFALASGHAAIRSWAPPGPWPVTALWIVLVLLAAQLLVVVLTRAGRIGA